MKEYKYIIAAPEKVSEERYIINIYSKHKKLLIGIVVECVNYRTKKWIPGFVSTLAADAILNNTTQKIIDKDMLKEILHVCNNFKKLTEGKIALAS